MVSTFCWPPIMTPLLMKLLCGCAGADQRVGHDAWDGLFKSMIFPIAGGLLFNRFLAGKIKWLDKAMPLVSMIGIAFIITIIALLTGR